MQKTRKHLKIQINFLNFPEIDLEDRISTSDVRASLCFIQDHTEERERSRLRQRSFRRKGWQKMLNHDDGHPQPFCRERATFC